MHTFYLKKKCQQINPCSSEVSLDCKKEKLTKSSLNKKISENVQGQETYLGPTGTKARNVEGGNNWSHEPETSPRATLSPTCSLVEPSWLTATQHTSLLWLEEHLQLQETAFLCPSGQGLNVKSLPFQSPPKPAEETTVPNEKKEDTEVF